MLDAPPPIVTPPEDNPTYSWSEVWTAVLTKPREETFVEILRDPNAKPNRAYLWIYLSSLITVFITLNTTLTDPAFIEQFQQMNPEAAGMLDSSAIFLSLLCIVPFASLLSIAGLLLITFAMQLIANQFGPTEQTRNRWKSILYVVAAVTAPLNIIGVIFVLLPIIGFLSLILTVYQIYLLMLGIKAIFGFSTMQALITVIVPEIALVLLAFAFIT